MKRKPPPTRKTIPVSRDFQEMVWALVDKAPGCWQWLGLINTEGYGQLTIHEGHKPMAARVIWELLYGPIPKGRVLLQKCKNRSCVRPDHRRISTPGEVKTTELDRRRRVKIPRDFETPFLPATHAVDDAGDATADGDVSRETPPGDQNHHGEPTTTEGRPTTTLAVDVDGTLGTKILISAVQAQRSMREEMSAMADRITELVTTVTSRLDRLERAEGHLEILGRLTDLTEQLGAVASAIDTVKKPVQAAPADDAVVARAAHGPSRVETIVALGRLFEHTFATALEPVGLLMIEEVFGLALEHAEHDQRLALETFRGWLGLLEARVRDGDAEPTARALRHLAARDLGLAVSARLDTPDAPHGM